MEKGDARKQPREVLHERRKQVIRMHRKGMPVMRIVEHSGLSWSPVRAAIAADSMAAVAALKPAARGKKQGRGRLLSESQERAVRQIICDKRPEQLKMEFARWNRAAVMQLIERECGIKLSVRGVDNYLKRWGFTPQKPIKKAYEQHLEAGQAWVQERKDKIELFYLPSYSPELNPEERLNADLKNALYAKVLVRTKAKPKAATTERMQTLEKLPERVRKFFQDARVKYAA